MVTASHSTRDGNEGKERTIAEARAKCHLPNGGPARLKPRLTAALFTAAYSRLKIREEKARMADGGTMAGWGQAPCCTTNFWTWRATPGRS